MGNNTSEMEWYVDRLLEELEEANRHLKVIALSSCKTWFAPGSLSIAELYNYFVKMDTDQKEEHDSDD